MADLVTHVGTALLFKGATRGRHMPIFVLGTVVPDVCGRVVGMGLSKIPGCPDLLIYGPGVIHMPLGMLAFTLLVSLLFREDQRGVVWANLLAGAVLHLAVDLLQHHVGTGYPLLFPFSTWHWELGLLGSEATIPYSIPLFLAGLALWRFRGSRRPPEPSAAPDP